ncbi:hypothetical protein EJB05_10830, partial [Eragrostis curvula]
MATQNLFIPLSVCPAICTLSGTTWTRTGAGYDPEISLLLITKSQDSLARPAFRARKRKTVQQEFKLPRYITSFET